VQHQKLLIFFKFWTFYHFCFKNFELRRYPASKWACTQIDQTQNQNSGSFQNNPDFVQGSNNNNNARNPDSFNNQFSSIFGSENSLKKLQRFLAGANSDRTTLETFLPVTTKFGSRFSRFCIF
jgi:hypothetical protein